ncbi:hypothetical protein, partial [Candidatus Williamhamiltonella defendens]|uniref:hypothetical protein n=1 Tax=Candidatus Williamhamiltonella defendens TaxID=138072 RepID=UPI0012FEB3CE
YLFNCLHPLLPLIAMQATVFRAIQNIQKILEISSDLLNGMKLVQKGARPISGNTWLKKIQELAESNLFSFL